MTKDSGQSTVADRPLPPLGIEDGQDKNIETVRSSANRLLTRFRDRLEQLRGNPQVTEKILRQGFNSQSCFEEAIRFFGREEVNYLAIDGTEFEDDRLDMLIFFAGAFGYTGAIRFALPQGEGEETVVTSDPPFASPQSVSLSCAVPLSEEYTSHVSGESTEGGVDVDPARVPQALMHFAEYYLAYHEMRNNPSIRVILMDRSVSGDIAHISWRMRDYIKSGGHCLEGFETSEGKITFTDLELGRMLVPNEELHIPPPRSQFLKFAAMQRLMEIRADEPKTVSSIIQEIRANKDRGQKLLKDLCETFRDSFVSKPESEESVIALRPEVKAYWKRLTEALDKIAAHIFNPPDGEHPLALRSGVGDIRLRDGVAERWLNTNDLDYLTLITIYSILREAWEKNILLIGIVKDSAANELVKAVIPILEDARIINFENKPPRFESDKMLLQANSIVNAGQLHTPWRTFEYDVCFRTIGPDTAGQKADAAERQTPKSGGAAEYESSAPTSRVMGAFRNVITCERMFVKAYFQLWSSSSDPSVRSHVFLYDRPCYPQYDSTGGASLSPPELVLKHLDSVDERIIPALHYSSNSPVSDLVLGILQSMGSEPIPEALGHNYPLFLADKKAKWLESEAAKACTAAVELEVARSKLDQQILYESRFRDYRNSVEAGRKGKSATKRAKNNKVW